MKLYMYGKIISRQIFACQSITKVWYCMGKILPDSKTKGRLIAKKR